MKTPSKLLILAALAIAVVAALTLKKGQSAVESKDLNSIPHLAVAAGDTTKVTPVTAARLPKLVDLGAGK